MKILRICTILMLAIIALPLLFSENCQIALSLDAQNNIYVSALEDDDGSIQFVDVYVTSSSTTQYSFENVSFGKILVNNVPPASTLSYTYSDYDGSMQCIGLFGNVLEPSSAVVVPNFLYDAEIKARLAEDNISLWLDIYADVNLSHQLSEVYVDYSLSKGGSATKVYLLKDGSRYKATIGPFRRAVSIYSTVSAKDESNRVQSKTLKQHNFEVVTTDNPECVEVVSSGTASIQGKYEEELLLGKPKEALFAGVSSKITLTYSNGLVKAADLYDDDSSIELVIVHVINSGIETSYEFSKVVKGQSFEVNIPSGAISYYNYSDYDGTVQGWGIMQQIIAEGPYVPPAEPVLLIDSVKVEAVPNSSFTSFRLKVSAYPVQAASIEKAYLNYRYSPNGADSTVEMDYNASSNSYFAILGPFFNELTLYGSVSARDALYNYNYKDLGVNWYRLVVPEDVKCIEICEDGNCNILPELFIKDAGIAEFTLVKEELSIKPKIKNVGLADAASFTVSLYIDNTLVGTESIGGLKIGEETTVEFKLDSGKFFGVHDAKLVLDELEQVPEINENNNILSRKFVVGYNIFNVILNYNNTDLVADERELLVLDRFGKSVADATLQIKTPLGKELELKTNSKGIVSLLLDSAGNYLVNVSKEDFESFNGSFAVPKINAEFSKMVQAGTEQKIRVFSADGKPVKDAVVKLTRPDGKEEIYYVDESGIISFKAVTTGTYKFEIIRKNISLLIDSFVSAGIVEVTMNFGSRGIEAIVGQEILSHPEIFLMLLIMCLIASVLAYSKSGVLFKKHASTREKKIQSYLRLVLAMAFFFLPLQVGKYFGFTAAVFFVLFEIVIWMLADYLKEKVISERKAIKV